MLARLDAEASRRGISLDQLITDRADTLPTAAVDDPLEAFIGCGSSGRTEPVDSRDERIRVARVKLATGS